MVLLTGNAKVEIAAALSELAQALNDLGLHDYASNVSGFALEILRDLYAADPDQFRSRIGSLLSLRANILVDLRQNDDAAGAAHEAVTILKEHADTRPELVYAMLNYAVLLGSIGRREGAAAVAFELLGYIDDPTILQPDIILVSPLCQLCVSTACIEFDSDLALSEADKAIDASRASMDANSIVVLAGALLAKSKILSSNGQNDPACSTSAEAVSLFRSASADRHVFSLLLAHAIFTHSNQLSEANRKGESYSTIHEAAELWQSYNCPLLSRRNGHWLGHFSSWRSTAPKVPTSKNCAMNCRLPSRPSAPSARCCPWIMLAWQMRYTFTQTACSNSIRIGRRPLMPKSPSITSKTRGRNLHTNMPSTLYSRCHSRHLALLHGTERGCSRVREESC
ncbi:hypothetical protein EI94DRAFT_977800 [Lactarius quietus]|nr:hypothetical protein EI94DRAFT_977800 [Lactarius quietus]